MRMRLTFNFFFPNDRVTIPDEDPCLQSHFISSARIERHRNGHKKKARRDALMSDCVIIAQRTRMIYGTTYLPSLPTDKWHYYRHTCIFFLFVCMPQFGNIT